MGPHNVLLEFEKKVDVIGSSIKIHGERSWDGMSININCIMSPQNLSHFGLYCNQEPHKKEEIGATLLERLLIAERKGSVRREVGPDHPVDVGKVGQARQKD